VKVRNRTGGYVLLYDLALGVRTEMRELTSGEPGSVGHACEDETSQMLHSYGHLVRMDLAQRAVHHHEGRIHLGGFASPDPALTDRNMAWSPPTVEEFARASAPTGVSGDPTKASAEKGARILDAEVENVCELIARCRQVDVEMKDCSIPI
jgi:creatinine amidohydrolase/Fe(II)-dependent formamide hydrolase-like protein